MTSVKKILGSVLLSFPFVIIFVVFFQSVFLLDQWWVGIAAGVIGAVLGMAIEHGIKIANE
jgi:uncharacterized membrane protein AbrB (regulator of aidB expression)